MNKKQKLVTVAAGCVLFGILMGLRDLSSQIWLRALEAGVAGAVLYLALAISIGGKRIDR